MNFFSELKRRNVYKVAVAYAVVGWLVVQIATQTFPFFEIPNWAVRLVILLVVIGFPIALIVAWAFELTPEGLKRTESADAAPKRQTGSRAWIYVVIAGAALSVGLFFVGRYTATWAHEGGRRSAASLPETSLPEKSVAVLPFENLSEDKGNAYFVDGMQDEVITRLAKIGELRVISRTSTQRYKTGANNLPEIARELGVSHLVEGTVQRVGDRVRINVQLIRAVNEGHLWAEIYDRNLTDIFAVQSELATAIARELQTKLTGKEEKAMAEKPTNNMAAYDAYLRGIDLASRPGQAPEDERNAADAFAEAARLDPQFAQAWARLSRVCAGLIFQHLDETPARKEQARIANETATRLNPTAPETLLANAYYRYHIEYDYPGARDLFEKLRREMPSSSEAVEALARIARRQSRWKESIRLFEEAARLNPRDAHLFMDRAWTFSMLREHAATLEMIERAAAIAPDDADVMENKVFYFVSIGDLRAARATFERIPPAAQKSTRALDIKAVLLTNERRFEEATRTLEEELQQLQTLSAAGTATTREWLAQIRAAGGDAEGAKKDYLQAKAELENLAREQPKNIYVSGALARSEAALGNKEAAIREAERGMKALPATEDPVFGPIAEENLANVEAAVGEHERAITRIEHLLRTPYGAFPLTVARLRSDPIWDPLRSNPRFKAIAEGPEPKTEYR